MATVRPRPLIARLSLDLQPGGEVQLIPDGEFTARDGRPGKGQRWILNAAIAASLIAAAAARQTPYVIDYEHQTMLAAENGQPAPAAGWFKALEYRPGKGLYATDVRWTEKARAMIEGGEYRFLSPVFSYDDQGRVKELLMAAITNVPALDQLDEVQLRAASRLASLTTDHEKEQSVNPTLARLIAVLCLAATANEDEALAAVTALKSKADGADALHTEIASLRTKVMDPTKFVPVEVVNELKTQLAALNTRVNERDVEEVISVAILSGKLATPAEQEYARTVGKQDIAALKAYIAAAPAIAALKGQQSGGKPPAGGNPDGSLDEEQLKICRIVGLSTEAFQAALKDQRAVAA